MDETYDLFVELWGFKHDECGASLIFNGFPVFMIEGVSEHQAYRMAEAMEGRKYAMSVLAHAMHPQYDEIDIVYYVADSDESDSRDWCEILYLKED